MPTTFSSTKLLVPQELSQLKEEELLFCFYSSLLSFTSTKTLAVDVLTRIPLPSLNNITWTVARIQNCILKIRELCLVNIHNQLYLELQHKLILAYMTLPEGKEFASQLPSRLRSAKEKVKQSDIDCTQAKVLFYQNDVKTLFYAEKVFHEPICPYYLIYRPDEFFYSLNEQLQEYVIKDCLQEALEKKISKEALENVKIHKEILEKINSESQLLFYYNTYFVGNFSFLQRYSENNNNLSLKIFTLVHKALKVQRIEDCEPFVVEMRKVLKEFRREKEEKKAFFILPEAWIFLLIYIKASLNPVIKEEVLKEYKNILQNSSFLPLEYIFFQFMIGETKTTDYSKEQLTQLIEKNEQGYINNCFYFLFQYYLDNARINVPLLKSNFYICKNLFFLPALIYAQILRKKETDNKEYDDFLADKPYFDFTNILEDDFSWAKRLEAIEKFLLFAEGHSSKPKKKVQDKPKRLVWVLDPIYKEIQPLEQVFTKDAWTAGRKIALVKLKNETENYPYITEQDQDIIRKGIFQDYWSGSYIVKPKEALPLLVGHPLIFNNQTGESIKLTLEELKLTVEENKDEFILTLPEIPDQPEVLLKNIENNIWAVTPVTSAFTYLKNLMGGSKLSMPQSAKEKVHKLINSSLSLVPVKSSIQTKEVSSKDINYKPTLRIQRTNGQVYGLDIHGIIYPLSEKNISYTPGMGTTSIVGIVGNQPVKISRDFQKEIAEIEAIIAKCPTLMENGSVSTCHWELYSPEICYEALQEIQQAQIAVEWFDSEPITLSKPIKASDLKLNISHKSGKWFEVNGYVQVSEDLILDMLALVKNLKKNKGRFIPLENGQILALTEDFRKLTQRISSIADEQKNTLLLHSLAAPALQPFLDNNELEVNTDALWKEWQEKIQHVIVPSVPSLLQADLRPYQEEGFQWLHSLVQLGAGACLADDMGLGKTLQTIALMLSLVSDSEKNEPMLIIAPTSVCYNWQAELLRFAPSLSVVRITAEYSKKDRAAIMSNLQPNQILIIGYGLLNAELENLCKKNFQLIVFDEAQALKNAGTMRSKASVKLKSFCKIALTGTPIENSLEDLWSIFNIINPGLLGSSTDFLLKFILPPSAKEEDKQNARNTLRSLIKPFILRRTKATVLEELPSRTEQTLTIEPSEEEKAFYEALRRNAVEKINKIAADAGQEAKRIHILAELTRLRRACCNPLLIDPNSNIISSKLLTLKDLIVDLKANNHKALVFSQFTGHLNLAYNAINSLNIPTFYLDGQTPEKKRGALVQEFQKGKADVFCISLKAGGQGLNLTAADYVIHLDPWWNPAVEDQASDRAHRMGQLRPVTIYRLIMKNTVEEKILSLHSHKRELAEDILKESQDAHKLSMDDLMNLFEEF